MVTNHDIADKRIPDKLEMMAGSPTARKAHVTMNRDMWSEFLSKDQRKNGVGQKEREAICLSIAQQWGLKWPISVVNFSE